MKKRNVKYSLLLVALTVFLGLEVIGCQSSEDQAPIPSPTKEQGTLIAASLTPAIIGTPTITITPTQESIQIPTLALEDARRRVEQLFETNNSCQLPCWWGITPGKTLWQDALRILAPISTLHIDTDLKQQLSTVAVKVHAPNDEHGKVLFQNYVVEDNVVRRIDVYNFDFAPFTFFKQFVHKYGLPSQIYIRGYRDIGFELALYYPEKGIFATYSRTSKSDGKILKACFDSAKSPFLYL